MLHEEGHLPLLRCTLLVSVEQGILVQLVGTHPPVNECGMRKLQEGPLLIQTKGPKN